MMHASLFGYRDTVLHLSVVRGCGNRARNPVLAAQHDDGIFSLEIWIVCGV